MHAVIVKHKFQMDQYNTEQKAMEWHKIYFKCRIIVNFIAF